MKLTKDKLVEMIKEELKENWRGTSRRANSKWAPKPQVAPEQATGITLSGRQWSGYGKVIKRTEGNEGLNGIWVAYTGHIDPDGSESKREYVENLELKVWDGYGTSPEQVVTDVNGQKYKFPSTPKWSTKSTKKKPFGDYDD
jgi:DNA-binding protein H-NS